MDNDFLDKLIENGRSQFRKIGVPLGRQQEEQAEKEERSQVLAQVRYERYKQERREFTARKRAGLLTPEEQAEEERRLERNRAYQQKQRDKKKASQPEKPRKRSLKELAKLDGADLTPEEAERLRVGFGAGFQILQSRLFPIAMGFQPFRFF